MHFTTYFLVLVIEVSVQSDGGLKDNLIASSSENPSSVGTEDDLTNFLGLGQGSSFPPNTTRQPWQDTDHNLPAAKNGTVGKSWWAWLREMLGNQLEDEEEEEEGEGDYEDDSDDHEEETQWKKISEQTAERKYILSEPRANPTAVLVVSTYLRSVEQICSGNIIGKWWVLTAGHCFIQIDISVDHPLTVMAGGYSYYEILKYTVSVGSQFRTSLDLIIHPDYLKYPDKNDVALLKVDRPFTPTISVKVARLSAAEWDYGYLKHCKFTGFGRLQNHEVHPNDFKRKTHFLTMWKPCPCTLAKTCVCNYPPTDGLGLCGGDSGAGLMCNRRLWATARGWYAATDLYNCNDMTKTKEDKCATNNTQTMFIPVYYNLNFINKYVKRVPSEGYSRKAALVVVLFSIVTSPIINVGLT